MRDSSSSCSSSTSSNSSSTRSPSYLKALSRIAGYELRVEEEQEGFPKELFPVLTFCSTAKREEKGEEQEGFRASS